MDLKGQDIISLERLSDEEIEYILKKAEKHEASLKTGGSTVCKDKVLAALFFEPSTRTRLSFESAMLRLGGKVLGFTSAKGTSASKGENLADTIRTIESYCDVIAMRHPVEGSAKLAAQMSNAPILNGGDGAHSHPTQTLLDLYTIKKEFNKFKGLRVALTGDLKYGRTVHSLSKALARFGANMVFTSPDELRMPKDITSKLQNKYGVHVEEKTDLAEVVKDVDVLYVTRIQKERFPDPEEYEKVKGAYRVDNELLANAKKGMIVMHPLPRVYEIAQEVDSTPYARYFQQAFNGVPVRMALISSVLGVD